MVLSLEIGLLVVTPSSFEGDPPDIWYQSDPEEPEEEEGGEDFEVPAHIRQQVLLQQHKGKGKQRL